jgi:hypothetical protein
VWNNVGKQERTFFDKPYFAEATKGKINGIDRITAGPDWLMEVRRTNRLVTSLSKTRGIEE